ncbi:hypothetical protein [Brevundimonas sp.]|uniref:hypothetical protein n=1 Tax=Brevundimonas sp. TaxID=1871086 RepID=UPI003F72B746
MAGTINHAILPGPGVLGAVFPDAHAAVFNPQVITNDAFTALLLMALDRPCSPFRW